DPPGHRPPAHRTRPEIVANNFGRAVSSCSDDARYNLSRPGRDRAGIDSVESASWSAQPDISREPRLIPIKRAKGTGAKRDGRSNMQDIQRASTKLPRVGSRNPPGMRKGSRGNR